jgi:transcriptional regulator with XRE-family HTH domain
VTFGDRLRLLRAARNLSQAQLGTRAGFAHATLSNLELNKSQARQATIEALAGALEVEARALTDDIACLRQLAQIAGVPLTAVSGEVAADDPLIAVARELAPRLGPARSAFLADVVRGLANLLLVGPVQMSAPASPPRPESEP